MQKNREVPDTYMTMIEYPGGYAINMVSCMANATSADSNLQYLAMDQIERVEVLRGSRSVIRRHPYR